MEDKRYATEALSVISQIKAPVYGAPGNHDYRSRSRFAEYEQAFAATGGAWLTDRIPASAPTNIRCGSTVRPR